MVRSHGINRQFYWKQKSSHYRKEVIKPKPIADLLQKYFYGISTQNHTSEIYI